MKEQQLKHVMDNLAEGLVPVDVDLWPAIRMRFETSKKRSRKENNLLKKSFTLNRRTLVAFASALAVILFGIFLGATPQGRAWAQGIIRFFTRAESDIQPLPTSTPLVWAPVTPGESAPIPTFPPVVAFAADCGDFNSPHCSVEKIRGKVNFPVMELGTIPEGMHFIGATGGPDGIALLYDNGTHTYGLVLTERPWTDNSEVQLPEIGASAVVETVRIGDVSGEYVKGLWLYSIPHADPFTTPTPGALHQVWDADEGNQTLVWVDNNVLFEMESYTGAGKPDKDWLVALAAGLTAKPVTGVVTPAAVTETPTPDIPLFDGNTYNLSVAQAEAQAGFDVLEPKLLPKIFFLVGASYQSEQNIVRLFYLEPTPAMPRTFGLRLSEQIISKDAGCELCGIVVGDYQELLTAKSGKVVGTNAVVETVPVGDFTAQYVEGMWGQWGATGAWKWLPYPEIMTLRWQANGMAFELYYSGFKIDNAVPISKADLIAIAESVMK